MRVRQHALRGFAGSAVDLPALEGVSAKIPMYLSRSARDRYVGHADADFTQRASDYWKFLTGGTVLDMAHLYWHSDTKTVQMHDARGMTHPTHRAEAGRCLVALAHDAVLAALWIA